MNKKIEFLKAHRRLDIILVALGLGIFVAITLFNVSRASIWFDEAFSSYITQFNFLQIAQYTGVDVHPPLYYWLLKVWEMVFGTTDIALRSMSIFFGATAITTAYVLSRRLFGRLVGGVSLLFLVLSPMLIRYGDEARMYTLATTIVLLATYVLIKATETNKRRYWVIYGILVGLGMWTHYFTALAWLAHVVWRVMMVRRGSIKKGLFWKKFFTKNVIISYIVAIGVFLPWLPFMAFQLGSIQGGGFWIGAVGSYSFTNYFTNVFYYLEQSVVKGWAAMLLFVVLGALIVLAIKTFRTFKRTDKQNYILILCLAFVPVILLFLASLPPFRSSFVERYVLPAMVAFDIFAAVTIVVGGRMWRPIFRIGLVALIAGMMIFGITNVYFYGNYNKNSNQHILTHELIEAITAKAKPGEPIVANSPWIFYEAVFYSTDEHPVYFIDKYTHYIYGSLDMLKYNDAHKIKDLDAFTKAHPTIWYIGNSNNDITAPTDTTWKQLDTASATSRVDGATLYRGTEFQVN